MELAVKVAVDPPLIVRTVSSLTVRILNWLENVTDPPPDSKKENVIVPSLKVVVILDII